MALKITTQIGTDKGITSEAYVRIADYQVSKYGSASFRIELFQAQADSAVNGNMYPSPLGGGMARNQQIGDSLWIFCFLPATSYSPQITSFFVFFCTSSRL
jgi:hypothetical protein